MSSADDVDLRRRRWLYAAVAAAAGLGGGGLAWWRLSPGELASDAVANFWLMSFDTPDGQRLAMQTFRGKPMLLNFWATWCPPCVEELPLLDSFFRENSANGWQVLGLAVDQPGPVRDFLQRQPLGFPIALAGLGGTGLSKTLGNLAGALPFTVVLGGDGTVRGRKIGKVSPEDLKLWRGLK